MTARNPATAMAQHARSSFDSGLVLDFRHIELMCGLDTNQRILATIFHDDNQSDKYQLSSGTKQMLKMSLERVVSTWCSKVPNIPEPQASPIPVVKIDYSPEFDGIMSFFRGITSIPEMASPRYCALLSFVLFKCPANYNAWRRKRDLVMDPEAFLLSAQQWWQLPTFPSLERREQGTPALCSIDEKTLKDRQGLVNTLRQFTPNLVRDFAEGSVYCPLRAVRWELNLARSFCIGNPKNFQTFCHRKELLTFAASLRSFEGVHLFDLETDTDPAGLVKWIEASRPIRHSQAPQEELEKEDPVMSLPTPVEGALESIPLNAPPMGKRSSQSGSGEDLSTAGDSHIECSSSGVQNQRFPLRFDQFDDRPLMNLMLSNDAKNYHVWSYRAWFMTFFPHLLSTEEGFSNEMIFTTEMIEKDFMNNSAWCHRLFLLRRLFEGTSGLERLEYSVEASVAGSSRLVSELYEDWSRRWEIAEDEIFNTVFKYLALEPNNECPYSHALGLIDLFAKSFHHSANGAVGSCAASITITNAVLSAPFFSAKIPGDTEDGKFEVVHHLPIDTRLHLLFVGRLFQQIFIRVEELEPQTLELETAVKASERRPSLVGTFYGRHFFSAVVDSLERALASVLDCLVADEEDSSIRQIVMLISSLLQSSLTSLFEKDTIRRKYWRQQLLNLQLELKESGF